MIIFHLLNLRLEESSRTTYGTPWDIVNDIMDGGLGVGELGVIVALLKSIGKSWTLQSLGSSVLKRIKVSLFIIHLS